MNKTRSGAEIRKDFIDFFIEHKHTHVPSASLVPGGDATLLFTNAGMVQFKDVFLGTDKRPYARAVNSQKCMRVAGKHNDLEDVGYDDYHHTFFEMLGNWSFGDYYKKEAITWAWQLLTDVWGLPKEKLYATCFKDDQGDIPADEEAASVWKEQVGFDPSHVLYFGRKENFWEMAETGPCGPCSEIHLDRGEEYDNLADKPHRCGVNGECQRFLELWNNVFIQYNHTSSGNLEPLPSKHVDTGMGFERIVAVLQGVDSNYKTDLLTGVTDEIRKLTGDSVDAMYANFTPYRVIADHARAAAFLIADNVVPGNIGRNYICRMIIRRAVRYGTKLGITDPFLGNAAEAIIATYGDFYPELVKQRESILGNLKREEERFARTLESGTTYLQSLLSDLVGQTEKTLDGQRLFELYATYGLPLELARDIAREQGMAVDETGFKAAMEAHRIASGKGKAMGYLGGEDAEFFARILKKMQEEGKLGEGGVKYDPYNWLEVEGPILAIVSEGLERSEVDAGDKVEILLPKTGFYIESGGQVADTGTIRSKKKNATGEHEWEIAIDDSRKPCSGVILHTGEVVYGHPKKGDSAIASIDRQRRRDIMRNHTATHLLHTALHEVIGQGARQAGSLVAPDKLRFDFTHPEGMTREQVEKVEMIVNRYISEELAVVPRSQNREEAIGEGAMALFGEKYGETVRTISIMDSISGNEGTRHSYELCGGTHLEKTSDIGVFLILSEGSAAAGIRRIEAVTGRSAHKLISRQNHILKDVTSLTKSNMEDVVERIESIQAELSTLKKEIASIKEEKALTRLNDQLPRVEVINGIHLLVSDLPDLGKDTLTKLADAYRERYPHKALCVIGSVSEGSAIVMSAVTQDLVKAGIKAGDLVNHISKQLGSGGGGAPHLAFGGGKDIDKLPDALRSVKDWVVLKLPK